MLDFSVLKDDGLYGVLARRTIGF